MRGRAAVVAIAAVVAGLAVTACGPTALTSPPSVEAGPPSTVPSTASSTASSGAPADTTGPTPVPPASDHPASDAPATSAPPSPAGAVVEDPSLLAVLPADLGGVPVSHEAQAFIDASTDRDFARNVEAAAFAVVVDGEDLASAVVARLNPGVYSEAFFRDWRDSYNEGACGQAGGVVGNAESELGKQTVYIGSCAGGLRTYHAWLADRGLIVSAFSFGDRRYGEQLMSGLRP